VDDLHVSQTESRTLIDELKCEVSVLRQAKSSSLDFPHDGHLSVMDYIAHPPSPSHFLSIGLSAINNNRQNLSIAQELSPFIPELSPFVQRSLQEGNR